VNDRSHTEFLGSKYSENDLAPIAHRIRCDVLEMVATLGRGYLQQGLGATDLLSVLFFEELTLRVEDPGWEDRDRFVLSTAHNSAVFYATLAERGFFSKSELKKYCQDGAPYEVLVSERVGPPVEATCGSLGQGLSVAVGMALSARRKNKHLRVYVLMGDAEMQEGQVWEAAMAAASHALGNLCLIVDVNQMQAEGPMENVINVGPVSDKWKAFGWNTQTVDGHDFGAIRGAFAEARNTKDGPSVILAATTVGKGVGFLEGDRCHNMYVTEEIAAKARVVLNESGS